MAVKSVKKENGITLMSLIIYIILLLLVTSMLAAMSTMFFNNKDKLDDTSKFSGELNKFNMFFIEDVKKSSKTYSVEPREVVFMDGTTYAYRNGAIYKDKVKICDNLSECIFTKRTDNSTGVEKEIINVRISIEGNEGFETENDYVLRYW